MYHHIIDRSDLDEVVAIKPGPDGYKLTRRQSLEREGMPRTDIVLVNGTRSGKQYCLFVRPEGFAGDLWILDVLTDEEHDEVQAIAKRVRQNALDFSPAYKLLW